jgi:hypothetical protein
MAELGFSNVLGDELRERVLRQAPFSSSRMDGRELADRGAFFWLGGIPRVTIFARTCLAAVTIFGPLSGPLSAVSCVTIFRTLDAFSRVTIIRTLTSRRVTIVALVNHLPFVKAGRA